MILPQIGTYSTMSKYKEKDLLRMEKIIESAGEGKTFQLQDNAAAVNMRQRIYNYRNSITSGRMKVFAEWEAQVARVTVTVKDNLVLVAESTVNYTEDIDKQLEED